MGTRIVTVISEWTNVTESLNLVANQIYEIQNTGTSDVFLYVSGSEPGETVKGMRLEKVSKWQRTLQPELENIYLRVLPTAVGGEARGAVSITESYAQSSGGGGGGMPGLPIGSIQYAIDADTFGGVPFASFSSANSTLNIGQGTGTDLAFSYSFNNNVLTLNRSTINGIELRIGADNRIFAGIVGTSLEVELYTQNTAGFLVVNDSIAETELADNNGDPIVDGNGSFITVPGNSNASVKGVLTKQKERTQLKYRQSFKKSRRGHVLNFKIVSNDQVDKRD